MTPRFAESTKSRNRIPRGRTSGHLAVGALRHRAAFVDLPLLTFPFAKSPVENLNKIREAYP